MARPTLARVVHTLRASARRKADVPDGDHELLARFVASRDEAAFRALVNRHARVVLAACRQVLSDPADVDDAFQATFLVLLKKAKAVDATTPLAGWLFAVAHRVAVRSRADNARRRTREAEAARRTRTAAEPPDVSWREAAAVLHAELNALPDTYRLPLLLCCVRGLSRDEAAAELGVPFEAVRWRLERGRTLLERRLTKRGVVLSAGLLAALMGSSRAAGGPPAELIDLAVRAATGHAGPGVAALAHGAFPMTTLKQALLPTLLVAALLGVGATLGGRPLTATADEKPAQDTKKPAVKPDAPADPKKGEGSERTITGKVVGPDGRPVAADLHLIWIDGKPEVLGKVNADGTFKVTVPLRSPGAYLVAKADGFGVDFVMLAPNTPAEVTFKLPKDVPVRGRVLDLQGQPVAGATVRLRAVCAYAGDSVQPFLDAWQTRAHFREPPARAARTLETPDGPPFTAATGRDGRFELAGVGGERVAFLTVRGGGRVETEAVVVTRPGFDPKPFNAHTLGLRPKTGERLSWADNWLLSGPDLTLAVEAEKPVRGRVTDAATGKPLAGVEVVLDQDDETSRRVLTATTDADGRYVIRGAKKQSRYRLRTHADAAGGFLPGVGDAADTAGDQAVEADVACQKGVVVTGTLRDRASGRPLAGWVDVRVPATNPHAAAYPALVQAPGPFRRARAAADGTFRAVAIPGPVLLAAAAAGDPARNGYTPAKADPGHPRLFRTQFGLLTYDAPGGAVGTLQANWCGVVEVGEKAEAVARDIDLDPAPRAEVRVVDADGKAVAGAVAVGTTHVSAAGGQPTGAAGEVTVWNVEPDQERLVAALHGSRKLVGAVTVKGKGPPPVLTLGAGGSVTGRVVGGDGKPLAGVTVRPVCDHREVADLYRRPDEYPGAVTGADGEFRLDTLLPGRPFRLALSRGGKPVGPDGLAAKRVQVDADGETKDLGDVSATVPPRGEK